MQRRTMLKSAAAGAVLAGIATVAAAQDDVPKVGFIYVGPVGDLGWSYQHDQGRQQLQEHFGDEIETVYIENVPEGPDAERVLTQLALQGADLIFATSFGFMEATNNVAQQFPDVKFEHATGYMTSDNLSVYGSRFYEGRAVEGLIAGELTESNIIGYIGSYPIPEVIRGINSSFLHAQKVNPDVEMRIVWAYSWFDPAAEAEAAQALIDAGADVVLQHTDSTAPQAAAQAAGDVYTFGQASDMSDYAPMPRVTSIIDEWGDYYIERTQALIDGTWETSDTWGGIDSGMVGIGEMTDAIPQDVRDEAQDLIDRIASGEYHPFTGPINKADGTQWLAEGEVATDEQLLSMDFYVEGIEAAIPD
ncbi:BMP family ABC transporter substrate-binding protein [Pseudoroseicyclus aestuarii]|uniref:Nucleoside-binding protein n=1 Tax=Pseudoroseicyclus aestuarii TaxID=1795041 RepID=A0A318SVW5_9RHOB|nr:BMP family ABC transporter substrate-binding protein [Pseudoroseicyclus aestuarii]PYE85575.1 nucleoside-binding protein [Pseudoroseicyclus aestuarii]